MELWGEKKTNSYLYNNEFETWSKGPTKFSPYLPQKLGNGDTTSLLILVFPRDG